MRASLCSCQTKYQHRPPRCFIPRRSVDSAGSVAARYDASATNALDACTSREGKADPSLRSATVLKVKDQIAGVVAGTTRQGVLVRTIVLRIVRSFLIQATSATFAGFPFARRR